MSILLRTLCALSVILFLSSANVMAMDYADKKDPQLTNKQQIQIFSGQELRQNYGDFLNEYLNQCKKPNSKELIYTTILGNDPNLRPDKLLDILYQIQSQEPMNQSDALSRFDTPFGNSMCQLISAGVYVDPTMIDRFNPFLPYIQKEQNETIGLRPKLRTTSLEAKIKTLNLQTTQGKNANNKDKRSLSACVSGAIRAMIMSDLIKQFKVPDDAWTWITGNSGSPTLVLNFYYSYELVLNALRGRNVIVQLLTYDITDEVCEVVKGLYCYKANLFNSQLFFPYGKKNEDLAVLWVMYTTNPKLQLTTELFEESVKMIAAAHPNQVSLPVELEESFKEYAAMAKQQNIGIYNIAPTQADKNGQRQLNAPQGGIELNTSHVLPVNKELLEKITSLNAKGLNQIGEGLNGTKK